MAATADQHPPGSPQAAAQGCTCSTTLNRHGQGTLNGQPRFYYDRNCPVHRSEIATIAKEAPKRPRRRPMPIQTLGQWRRSRCANLLSMSLYVWAAEHIAKRLWMLHRQHLTTQTTTDAKQIRFGRWPRSSQSQKS